MSARDVMRYLLSKRINVSVSPPTSTPLDATRRKLPDIVRASPHYYNTTAEIRYLAEVLRQMPV
jgi:cysteine desulfurase/selenocysteine lyase